MAGFDGFLVFTEPSSGGSSIKITAETQDAAFKASNAIEVMDFTFGVANTVTVGSATTGAGAGKAVFNTFEFKIPFGQSAVRLLRASAQGAHYTKVVLYLRKSGATGASTSTDPSGISYAVFTFGIVFISEVDFAGATGDEQPVVTVKADYGAVNVSYKPQNPDGRLGTAVMDGWNRVKNAQWNGTDAVQ